MPKKYLLSLIASLALMSPAWVLAVSLDPGTVGNYFTYTAPGTVDALDGNSFSIEFSDSKFITITPYETDARFVFGIDFNSSGLEPASVSGYLTDSLGNEIAGTRFDGLANSSGIGNGILALNEVVIAYGAHITFTDTFGVVPTPPFPVRFGSGVLSNVFEDRPVIGQDDTPEPGDISIDKTRFCATADYFEFEVKATGTAGEMVFLIAADSDPDPQAGPTERIATQINALSGDINSEANPIAESFGAPPVDRWQDGYLTDYSVVRADPVEPSWTFSGRVTHGVEPFQQGDSLWGVTLIEGDAMVTTGPQIIEPCDPTAIEIVVPGGTPQLDGRIDYQEWRVAPQLQLEGGSITFVHDQLRLYILIDMLEDRSDNALRDGGPDQFSLLFDIDEDGSISANMDRRYRMLPGTGNFRYETYADSSGSTFNPPEAASFSALGEGFGCFLSDGSATITPLSCFTHRVWEVGIDLLEIEAAGDKTARLGLQVQSELDVLENLPANLARFSDFIRLQLTGATNLDIPSKGMPTRPLSNAELHVTQAIQREDSQLALVQSRTTYVDLLVDTDEELAESVTTSVFASRDGIDLPGSPFTLWIKYNNSWGSSNRRSGPIRTSVPIGKDAVGSEMIFRMVARQPLLEARLDTPERALSFVPTITPVYWIVPVNTGDNATPNLPDQDFLLRSELEVRAAFPVADVDFVRRPAIRANPDSAADAIALLNQYDQQALLAWTLGLLITGESPFALPDQIIGAFPADANLDGFLGMSDPLWWQGGAGRVVWIKDTVAENGLLLPHELNHNLDTNLQGSWGRHTAGCTAGGLNPQWPYPDLTIQQPALVTEDVIGRNGVSLSPSRRVEADTPDYMSYCRKSYRSSASDREAYPYQWVSPYRWRRQLEEVFADDTPPLAAGRSLTSASFSAAASMPAIEDVLYVSGAIRQSDGGGFLQPVLMQPGMVRDNQQPGDYAIRLADCSDNTLYSMAFSASFTDVEGQARTSSPFAMVLPNPGNLCAVQLQRGDALLAERRLSPNSPMVTVTSPNGGEYWDGTHTLRWEASDIDGDSLTASILYSPDEGRTWLPVAGGITASEYSIDSAGLPGSEQALFRLLVSDGLNTAQDDSDSIFQVAAKPPVVRIISPALTSGTVAGDSITLRGSAHDAAGRALSGNGFVWQLDGLPIAIGNQVLAVLGAGEQQLELLVTGENGLTGQAAVMLDVEDGDSDDDGVPDDEDFCPDSVPGALVTVASCPTQVENRILATGCSLEEVINETLEQEGRDSLVQLLHDMRKSGELDKAEAKAIKKCVREDD